MKDIASYASFIHQYYFLCNPSIKEEFTESTTLTTSGRHRKEKHLRNNDAYNREEEPDILGGCVDGKE